MASYTNNSGRAACRLPGGHPEAFFEAFANVYRDGLDDMVARKTGQSYGQRNSLYPNVYDGVEGLHFIDQCLASNRKQGDWQSLHHPLARS